ncbi:hypothetical protein PIIN_09035 [Serendipita indica DSM 11827]|uniref:Uncharacterized protein n=1 Tax=Serendipita indica (strain DSM 11827) TaxID=1109443 RepID=G4TUQ7_SERID|nr:hypothetical protein PIIN_09035 [Serendipita indica DSM 11827]
MATTNATTPTSNLRPLSLTQRPLQLRSASPLTPVSPPTNHEHPNGQRNVDTPGNSQPTTSGSQTPSIQRHQKRYSVLSYSNSPRSPAAPSAFNSPVVSNYTESGEQGISYASSIPGSLSRSSSRSSIAGQRSSIDTPSINRINKRFSIPKRPGEPGTPTALDQTSPLGRDSPLLGGEAMDETSSQAESSSAVLTLAEEHAELLQNIAQKEAKCLELRTQLSAQEEELKALKARWTSIVQQANPNASQSSSGSIALAAMGRIFSNVTAPLASALDALDPIQLAPDALAPRHRADTSSGAIDPRLQKTIVNGIASSRGHTPASSARSSASSFAASRASISSTSSLGLASEPLHENAKTGDDVTSSTTPTPTLSKAAHRNSLLMPHFIGVNPEIFSPTQGSPMTPEGSSKTNWAGLEGLNNIPGASALNKKWEEIQKGNTFAKGTRRASTLLSEVSNSFINTFAPPIDEPLRPAKPRLISSRPASTTPTPQDVLPKNEGMPASKSLLDDEDDVGELDVLSPPAMQVMAPVKPPTPLTPSVASKHLSTTKMQGAVKADDDTWNW